MNENKIYSSPKNLLESMFLLYIFFVASHELKRQFYTILLHILPLSIKLHLLDSPRLRKHYTVCLQVFFILLPISQSFKSVFYFIWTQYYRIYVSNCTVHIMRTFTYPYIKKALKDHSSIDFFNCLFNVPVLNFFLHLSNPGKSMVF